MFFTDTYGGDFWGCAAYWARLQVFFVYHCFHFVILVFILVDTYRKLFRITVVLLSHNGSHKSWHMHKVRLYFLLLFLRILFLIHKNCSCLGLSPYFLCSMIIKVRVP